MNDILVSIEWLIGKLDLHVIVLTPAGGYTKVTDSIYNRKTMDKLITAIMYNDFNTLTNFVKDKYELTHVTVRFSYGKTLRLKIKNFRKENKF